MARKTVIAEVAPLSVSFSGTEMFASLRCSVAYKFVCILVPLGHLGQKACPASACSQFGLGSGPLDSSSLSCKSIAVDPKSI